MRRIIAECGSRRSQGRDHRTLARRARRENPDTRRRARARSRRLRDHRRAAEPRRRGKSGRARAPRQGEAADEGQPAHRRADGSRGPQGDRAQDIAADQPLLHHGRRDLSEAARHHRRGDQHLPDARGQGRHRPERDRPHARSRYRAAARCDPLRGRDDQPEDPVDDRCRRLVQDGRSRPDHRRRARRPAGARQRHQQGRGADQGHRLAGRGRRRHPAGAGSRGRQHAGQEPDLPRRGRRRRHRPRRPRPDHPDQPRRRGAHANGLLRRRRDLRHVRSAPPLAQPRRDRHGGYDTRRQRRLVEHQVLGLRTDRRDKDGSPVQGADRGHRRAPAPLGSRCRGHGSRRQILRSRGGRRA